MGETRFLTEDTVRPDFFDAQVSRNSQFSLLAEVRRLRWFVPPHQEIHHDADDDDQNSTDHNQAMRHVLDSFRCIKAVSLLAVRSFIYDAGCLAARD